MDIIIGVSLTIFIIWLLFRKTTTKNSRKNIFLKIGLIILSIGSLLIANHLINSRYFEDSNTDLLTEIEDQIPPPPSIYYEVTKHDKSLLEFLKNCNLSGEKRKLVEACDYTAITVRNKSVEIAGRSEGTFNLGQICDIFDYSSSNWKYVDDPIDTEIIQQASSSINNGLNGDCDDFATLVCSMVLSIGGEARINYAQNSETGHAFTEVNLGSTNTEQMMEYLRKRYKSKINDGDLNYRKDIKGNIWLNLDWFANYPGGQYFNYDSGTTFYILQKYCEDFQKQN